jgi:CRISPR-associated protein (TIGR03986 family)
MITAPYAFARIPRLVIEPGWKDEVSHDRPFSDGLSGTIELTIRAETPLLVGGVRRRPRKAEDGVDARRGVIWPVQLPDGRFAIPGSTLQGLVRATLEIAAFGRLGPWIDDKRFGIRDLSENAKPYYRDQLLSVKHGFLRRCGSDFQLIPCEFDRIAFASLPNPTFDWTGTLRRNKVVRARYEAVVSGGAVSLAAPRSFKGVLQPCFLVLTGVGAPGKLKEWLFKPSGPIETLSDFEARFAEFLQIHEPDDGRDANPNWEYYRDTGYLADPENFGHSQSAPAFNKGGWMPIFYLETKGRIDTFGLAGMFKKAHAQSTHDLLRNSSRDHLEDRRDLASLIFGEIADESDADARTGLRRRAAFDMALAPRDSPVNAGEPTVLSAPKPSYWPIYVRQKGRADGNKPYATYTPLSRKEHWLARPELAGVKLWPTAKRADLVRLPPPPTAPDGQQDNLAIQTRLVAVDQGATFRGAIRFHNLKPQELGAILWALTLGDEKPLAGRAGAYWRSIGMAKAFGLGGVSFAVTGSDVRPNKIGALVPTLEQAMEAFKTWISLAYTDEAGGDWRESVQVKALQTAGSPVAFNAEQRRHMSLQQYADGKNGGHVLPAYATGHEAPKPEAA